MSLSKKLMAVASAWLEENWPFLVVGVSLLAVIAAAIYAVASSESRYRWFMGECMKDRKEYECEAMYRRSQ